MTVNQVEPKAKADKKSHQRCRDLHVIIYTKYFLYHCCLGGYEPVKITFQIFVLANLRFCQKSARENRARGNRKTLKRPQMMSKNNFRNLKLKSHEKYLISRTFFVL